MLRIIDAQNLMIAQCSVDSFIRGFCLAWETANELNQYIEERPEPEDAPARMLLRNYLIRPHSLSSPAETCAFHRVVHQTAHTGPGVIFFGQLMVQFSRSRSVSSFAIAINSLCP